VSGNVPTTGLGAAVFVISRSAVGGVWVAVGVVDAVAVVVAVPLGVADGVLGLGVAVDEGVKVLVGVFVTVDVALGVAVGVSGSGVLVIVAVGVSVTVGVGVCARTCVEMTAVLFVSFCSETLLSGSTIAVLPMAVSTAVVTYPVTVMVPMALGPVPNGPRSQSSRPPVMPFCREQTPRVVLNPVYTKFAAGWSVMRTPAAGWLPTLRTRMV
jgi:hypothetical protein